jgi:hypothetical protein
MEIKYGVGKFNQWTLYKINKAYLFFPLKFMYFKSVFNMKRVSN